MVGSFITAIRTLTILPFPGNDAKDPASSLPFFPLVGLGIGGIFYGCGLLATYLIPNNTLLSGVLLTLISVVLTGALHLDGLADVADAFGGGKNRERILEIMKDPRHGTFGSAAITLSLIFKTLLFSIVLQNGLVIFLLFMPFFTRTYQALGCTYFPYARPNGGTASPFISPKYRLLVSLCFLIQTAAALYLLNNRVLFFMIICSVGTALFFFYYCKKRIGGITGDCLGAGNELSEIVFLLSGVMSFHYFH